MTRYIVTNSGMMKGLWRVWDTLLNAPNDTGLRSKKGAQAIANTYNKRGYGLSENDRTEGSRTNA